MGGRFRRGCFYGFVKHLSGLTSTFQSPLSRGPTSTLCCQILTPCPLKGEGLMRDEHACLSGRMTAEELTVSVSQAASYRYGLS